jgi:outer membrane protein TolC
MKVQLYKVLTIIFLVSVSLASLAVADEGLPLKEAIKNAQGGDPWLDASRDRERAYQAESISAGTLPDPRVSVTARNLPVDTFDFNQEAMTQFSVGVTQMFPRGDTLELKRHGKKLQADEQAIQRSERRARVRLIISRLWLTAYEAQNSIELIERDRNLFEQLVDVAESNYGSALNRSRQQDVVRAQLEMTRLEDRLTDLRRREAAARRRLGEWIGPRAAERSLIGALPESAAIYPGPQVVLADASNRAVTDTLMNHPEIRVLDKRISVATNEADLARQKYWPEWGVTASYGYRDRAPGGQDRADLFSVGVTFDLPIFTGKRQDSQLNAAIARKGAVKTDKALQLRSLKARLETASAELAQLNDRVELYDQRLLPQIQEQAEAALIAYNNDDGDFAEAVRARIDELNAKIEALAIDVARGKITSQINYLLSGAEASRVAQGGHHE